MFWILTVCLFALASLFVLIPVLYRGQQEEYEEDELRRQVNINLFHERSDELEAELARGNLEQAQFDALTLELQQSLLSDVNAGDDTPSAQSQKQKTLQQKKAKKKSKQKKSDEPKKWPATVLVPVFCAVLMPVFAYSLYGQWGYIDDVELMDLFQRTVNNVDDVAETQHLIVSLGEVVQADEGKPWAWYFLAENFASLGLFSEAEIAYKQSSDRMDESPEKALVLGRLALSKYVNADLEFNDEVLAVVEQARAINPSENFSLQLLATDAQQRQDYRAAISYWRLLIQSNPGSEQAQVLKQDIAAAQQLMLQSGEDADIGPTIDVNIALAEGLELASNLRVFIAARNAEREGTPPLAATSLTVGDLPTTIRLDNSSAMIPAFNLASADTVMISALVSFLGAANPQSGDYRVVSENFSHIGQHTVIDLIIADRLP